MQITFTDEQKTAFKNNYAPQAAPEQFNLFISDCERRGFIPGVHVVFQLRSAMEYDPRLNKKVPVQKVTLITTINALRLIAERSGKFKGYGNFVYHYPDKSTSTIPLGKVPHAVSVEMYREGWAQPVLAVARFDAYCQTYKNGDSVQPTAMWRTRGEEQLAKCAEALGLRMIAPEECGGLYLAEEINRDATVE